MPGQQHAFCLQSKQAMTTSSHDQTPPLKTKTKYVVFLFYGSMALGTNITINIRESNLGFWYCGNTIPVCSVRQTQAAHIQLFVPVCCSSFCMLLSWPIPPAEWGTYAHPFIQGHANTHIHTERHINSLSSVCTRTLACAHTNRLWYSGSISQIISPHWAEIHFPHVIFHISQGHLQLIQSL